MDSSPFRKLPAELRIQIFELVSCLPSTAVVYFDPNREVNDLPKEAPLGIRTCYETEIRSAMGALSVCKEIRAECLPTFFAVNTFRLITEDLNTSVYYEGRSRDEDRVKLWLEGMGKGAAQHIKHARIDLGWLILLQDFFAPKDICDTVLEYKKLFPSPKTQLTFGIEVNGDPDYIDGEPSTLRLQLPLHDLDAARHNVETMIKELVELEGDIAHTKDNRSYLMEVIDLLEARKED